MRCTGTKKQLDFIRIDVQRSENAVLDVMTRLLGQCRVEMIVEFWRAGLALLGYGAERMSARLAGLGVRLYDVDKVEFCVR
jgi:hypothetical protein